MKRMKMTAMAFIAALGILTAGITAAAAETGDENLADLFYTYSNDNIVMDYTVPEYLTPEGNLQLEYFNGFLFLQQIDLNWDGVQELLAVRIKTEKNADGIEGNYIVAEIYQREENTLQRKCQYNLAAGVLQSATARIDIFTHDTDYGTIICCEAKDAAAIGADGIFWSMRAAAFDGTNLNELCNVFLSGSSFGQQDFERAQEAMYAADLYPYNVIDEPVVEQTEGLISDYTITRSLTADSQTVSDYINGIANDGMPMQYGETRFRSITNTSMANKIPGEFSSVIGAEPQSDVSGVADAVDDVQQTSDGYYYEADYVIPDSSQRYITREELQGLTEEQILLARNEIYAKHGRIFNNEKLDEYFRGKNWYMPSVEGAEFTEEYAARVFNDYEIKNISAIVEYEEANGLNEFD
ncbi:MAG: YARHG domain-containing protein [Eubacteriales bacterium]|nr:YARHG domain-containing protein [Eubacteriales bacterium]